MSTEPINITLRQLQVFVAVAEQASFSKAARELYTSQPHVSMQIKKLEDHFGLQLFHRDSNSVTPTEAGLDLLKRTQALLARVRDATRVMQEYRGLERGTLYIASTATAGNFILPPFLAEFSASFPDVVVELRIGNSEEVFGWLDEERFDIGVTALPSTEPSLTSRRFFEDELCLIAPPKMEDLPDRVTVEEFARLPKIAREPGSATLESMLNLLGGGSADGRDFVAQMDGATMVNEAVAAGIGVGLVPRSSAQPWLESGRVRCLELDLEPLVHTFYLVYRAERYVSPPARAFLSLLEQHDIDGSN